jgi:hypothetical protein
VYLCGIKKESIKLVKNIMKQINEAFLPRMVRHFLLWKIGLENGCAGYGLKKSLNIKI